MNTATITGWGKALPPSVLTNSDLEKIMDTSDEWILTRTGIRSRRRAAESEATSDLAITAARRALEHARMDPAELDTLLVATATPDSPVPAVSCLVQAGLGAANAAAGVGERAGDPATGGRVYPGSVFRAVDEGRSGKGDDFQRVGRQPVDSERCRPPAGYYPTGFKLSHQ